MEPLSLVCRDSEHAGSATPKNASPISRITGNRELFVLLEVEELKPSTIELGKRNTKNQTRRKPKHSIVNVILDRTSTVLMSYLDLDRAHRRNKALNVQSSVATLCELGTNEQTSPATSLLLGDIALCNEH